MRITEVRIKLTSGRNEKLRAFCSITIDDDFVIRDLKIIEGTKGAFVAMPSRKLMARCHRCSGKNHHRARFCNECGVRIEPDRVELDGKRKLHADIAHPINSECRERIQQEVLEHYQIEQEKSKQPDYEPVDIDEGFEDEIYDEFEADDGGNEWTTSTRRSEFAADDEEERAGDDSPTDSALEDSEWAERDAASGSRSSFREGSGRRDSRGSRGPDSRGEEGNERRRSREPFARSARQRGPRGGRRPGPRPPRRAPTGDPDGQRADSRGEPTRDGGHRRDGGRPSRQLYDDRRGDRRSGSGQAGAGRSSERARADGGRRGQDSTSAPRRSSLEVPFDSGKRERRSPPSESASRDRWSERPPPAESSASPARARRDDELDTEPEDNFGAGLFQ